MGHRRTSESIDQSDWSLTRSRRSARALLLRSALVLLVAFLRTPHARADAASESRQRYERALSLYEEGVYDAALVELKRAYELRPSYKLLYNIAQVHLALHDYAAATSVFEEYLIQGADQISAERRQAVTREIARLALRVGQLRIRSDVNGAGVFVDDVPLGETPLPRALRVNSGVRHVVLRHPDHPEQRARVSVAGGETQALELNFAPARAATVVASPPAPFPEAPERVAQDEENAAARPTATSALGPPLVRKFRRRLVLGWSFAGTLAAGAASVGALALLKSHALQDKRRDDLVGPNELDRDAARVRKLALFADGLAIAAAAAGVLSIWFTVGARRDRRATSGRAGRGVVSPLLGLNVNPAGLNLHARY